VSTSTDKNQALRLLRGLDEGGMDADEAALLARELDPVLVHVIVRFLREVYPASDPAASPILERVVQLTSTYPAIVEKTLEGERDPVSEWFASEYTFKDFRGLGPELIELIVDKLET
jgi:hypothetical protein